MTPSDERSGGSRRGTCTCRTKQTQLHAATCVAPSPPRVSRQIVLHNPKSGASCSLVQCNQLK
jgi:hypothetical protein